MLKQKKKGKRKELETDDEDNTTVGDVKPQDEQDSETKDDEKSMKSGVSESDESWGMFGKIRKGLGF